MSAVPSRYLNGTEFFLRMTISSHPCRPHPLAQTSAGIMAPHESNRPSAESYVTRRLTAGIVYVCRRRRRLLTRPYLCRQVKGEGLVLCRQVKSGGLILCGNSAGMETPARHRLQFAETHSDVVGGVVAVTDGVFVGIPSPFNA